MFKLSEDEERENDYERLRRKFNFINIKFNKTALDQSEANTSISIKTKTGN